MQISSRLRAVVLVWALLIVAGSARAQDTFKVLGIRQTFSADLIKVGNDWRKDLPRRLEVALQVHADTHASSVFVHAYFYDKDDHLVATCNKPNAIWTTTQKGIQEVELPEPLSASRINNVYFALPEDLQAKKWTTVLVVFGNKENVAATAMPSSELPKLEFPEKSKLAPPR